MSEKQQTAVEYLVNQLIEFKFITKDGAFTKPFIDKAKAMEKKQMIDLIQALKDYTYESHTILGHDEREAEEFVNIFLNK